MNILFASSEAAPFAKTGGLGDVCGTLPKELVKKGVDARVILPKYGCIPKQYTERMEYITNLYISLGWRRQYCGVFRLVEGGVTFYFVDNEFYFGGWNLYGPMYEDIERFTFFSKAVLSLLPCLDFWPDVIHCNDWQTALIPVLLDAHYRDNWQYSNIRTLLTIHNLKFQGRYDIETIADLADLPQSYFTPDKLEYYKDASLLKGGVVFANGINTVSPTYKEEIKTPYFGEGVDGILRDKDWKLWGILNGIDYEEYNPKTDAQLAFPFDSGDAAHQKQQNKLCLQEELGLPRDADCFMIAMVSRLTGQKGLDLIERVLNEICDMRLQLVVLGTGEERYENLFRSYGTHRGDKVSAQIRFDSSLSHRIYAASDAFLMPSLFEPCGLSQMIAMHYGSLPIVRETGGLKDSVLPYNEFENTGTGFSFANYNAHEMLYTIQYACHVYYDCPWQWQEMQKRAMEQDFSWSASADRYISLYHDIRK